MGTTNFDAVEATTFTGDLTGNVTGNVEGGLILPTATAYATDGAISPSAFNAALTQDAVGAYTLAAPGAANVGHVMYIHSTTARAHVVTGPVWGYDFLTWGGTIGSSALLYAATASAWAIVSLYGVTPGTD